MSDTPAREGLMPPFEFDRYVNGERWEAAQEFHGRVLRKVA